MTQNQELIAPGSQRGLLAKPVNVVPKVMGDYAMGLVKHAQETTIITTSEQFKEVGDLLNNAQKTLKSLDTSRLNSGKHLRNALDEIDMEAKPFLNGLKAVKEKCEILLQDADRRQRIEIARQAEEKEQQRLKAEQLQLEADTRQANAEKGIVTAKDDSEFHTAADEFDKGVVVQGQALEMKVAAMSVPLPELFKAKGTKPKMKVVDLVVTDLGALPLHYHEANEKKITQHILDGTLNADTKGITYRLEKVFGATGR